MPATQGKLSDRQRLQQGYRDAFRQFRRDASKLNRIQQEGRRADLAETEVAVLRLERAHLAYNDARDRLAASLMSEDMRQSFLAIPASVGLDHGRVSGVAELLWQLAGKPQGTAETDWYRAEKVLRHAEAEVCAAG